MSHYNEKDEYNVNSVPALTNDGSVPYEEDSKGSDTNEKGEYTVSAPEYDGEIDHTVAQ